MTAAQLIPPKLRRGDTIGLFCPAGPVRREEQFQKGLDLLTDMGFRFKVQGAYLDNGEYLADIDQARVNSLHALLADEEVKAIIALRGGFGSLRLLPFINIEHVKRHPKYLVGFSDVTALLSCFVEQAGVLAVHGPVLTSFIDQDRASLSQLFTLLSGNACDKFKPGGLEILRTGLGAGKLIGGNLTTLVHLIGTAWEPSWDGAILLLEDTGEHMYRLDRMLTHLALSGKLEKLAGLILGRFDPGHDDRLETLRLQERVWSRALELTRQSAFPIWGNMPVGHQGDNYAIPIGLHTTMDSSTATLRFHWDTAQKS